MIVHDLLIAPEDLSARTGWMLEPEGLCRAERCVPFDAEPDPRGHVDLRTVAERLRMPLEHDERHGIWALGPESGGRVLATAVVPPIVLADFHGEQFDLARLRGNKVVLHAWASW